MRRRRTREMRELDRRPVEGDAARLQFGRVEQIVDVRQQHPGVALDGQ